MSCAAFLCADAVINEPTFTIDEAIQSAIDLSPALSNADSRIQSKISECHQAGVYPNPVLTIGCEQIGLSSHRGAFKEAEASIGVTQLIELGRKRSARQNVVAAEAAALQWEREVILQKLVETVVKSYARYISTEERISLLKNLQENATQKVNCLKELSNSGKIKVVDHRKSTLAFCNAQNERRKAESQITIATRQLQMLAGDSVTFVAMDRNYLFSLEAPQPLAYYLDRINENPELERQRFQQLAAYYRYILEKANAVPDMIVTAGVERDSCPNEYSLFLQLDFEIPVFNRNRGNINAACWDHEAFISELVGKQNELTARCHELHENWVRCFEALEFLKNNLIPTAEELLQLQVSAEEQQKQNCLERFEANEQIYTLQLQYMDLLQEYHEIRAEMNALCKPLSTCTAGISKY
jgi:cobalt-zinc-cadmium efflux system outer membrane protein